MKRTIIYKTALAILFFAAFSSCKKDEESTPSNTNDGPIPTSIVGNWEIDGQNLPQQNLKDKYSKWTFTVNADDSYSLKYIEKGGKVTDFTGKVVVWASDVKHSNGTFIQQITVNVTHINGQPSPGGWKGIFAFEAGNIMKLNIEPNVSGINGPTPKAGFGSGSGGNNTVYNFVKK